MEPGRHTLQQKKPPDNKPGSLLFVCADDMFIITLYSVSCKKKAPEGAIIKMVL